MSPEEKEAEAKEKLQKMKVRYWTKDITNGRKTSWKAFRKT